MANTELVRDKDFFRHTDLVHMAAVRRGKKQWPTPDHRINEQGVEFPSEAIFPLDELGLGKLLRVDSLFAEFVARLHPALREGVPELGVPGGPFRYEPGEAKWFFKESAKKQLFDVW
ncbi:MAG: hypothetical protein AAB787_02570, partial [Patescibacteria group bacterium]